MTTIWLVPVLLLTGCAGLGVTAPDYVIGIYRGAVIGRGACNLSAAELTVNVAKWSAYGDWYFEQQNIHEQFLDGAVDSGGFLWGRRTPPDGMVYVGGFFTPDGSALDVKIDTQSCSYRGTIARI
jgi:hypothetical protein